MTQPLPRHEDRCLDVELCLHHLEWRGVSANKGEIGWPTAHHEEASASGRAEHLAKVLGCTEILLTCLKTSPGLPCECSAANVIEVSIESHHRGERHEQSFQRR